MPFLGLGKYGGEQSRLDRKQQRFDMRQERLDDTISRLRKKSEDKGWLSNFVSGRNRKIAAYDMVQKMKADKR